MSTDDDRYERVAASQPVNRLAARVTSPAERYVPNKKILTADQPTPLPTRPFAGPPEHDLTGARRGELTVLGMSADVPKRWVCRCSCGTYTMRRAKALKNEKNDDCCEECRHKAYLRRNDRWRMGLERDE